MTTEATTTDVAIIGGGPAGLMLAIELGCRGVRCVLLEEDLDPPALPKANATSARTMEHYRRRGFADEVRALGLPADHPQDVVYCTRLAEHELTRFRIPSRGEIAARSSFGDYGAEAWPTPELPHRAQQMYIEPILSAQAARHASVELRMGARASAVQAVGGGAEVAYLDARDGATRTLQARYVVGCDGPRSLVRQSMGVVYSGQGSERREFFGGQMVSIYFRSPDIYGALNKPKAWQYWAVNPQQRGLLVAVNGVDTFVLIVQLKEGQQLGDLRLDQVFDDAIGARFTHELIALTPWNAGYALVAETFRKGPLFIAGDAAHLFTPTAGMGYNTSVDDVVNLGWKLAAAVQGWGSDALLDSYQAERRPIALRNTRFARSMADSIGGLQISGPVQQDGREGDAARVELGLALAEHVRREFNIPGLQLGVCYAGSPVVAVEGGDAPPDEPNRYVPSGYPGARAPHVALAPLGSPANGGSLFDRFGRDLTLLGLGVEPPAAWAAEAARRGIPLATLRHDDPAARALYGAELVLVRPDHHIAWRGDALSDPSAALALATAQPPQAQQSVAVPTARSGDIPMPAIARRHGSRAVHSLDHFVYTVPDLDEAERFYRAFGLDVEREPVAGRDAVRLRTFGHPHTWGTLYEAPGVKRLQYLRFGVFEDDLSALTERIVARRLGIDAHPLGALGDGRSGPWVRGPDGLAIQLVVADKVAPSQRATAVVAEVKPGCGAAPLRSKAALVKPRHLSHILLFTADVPAALAFYEDVLGLRLSDRSSDIIAFMHGAHGSDHHLVALAKSSGGGLHHTSWDVGSVHDVGQGMEQLKSHGYGQGWGVGRHVLGSNYFFYARDPWGSYAEYSFDIDFVPHDLDWPAADHAPEDSFYIWGPEPPADFVTNYEQGGARADQSPQEEAQERAMVN